MLFYLEDFCSSSSSASSIRSGVSRYDSSLFLIPELNCLSFIEVFSSWITEIWQ